jgi:hypothetical protein
MIFIALALYMSVSAQTESVRFNDWSLTPGETQSTGCDVDKQRAADKIVSPPQSQ